MNGIMKAKAEVELNLAGDAKNNNKGFCRCIGQKIKFLLKTSTLLTNKTAELVTTFMEKG